MNTSQRGIVNVGSVGQQRDRDRRASCTVYNPETNVVERRRYRYDIDSVVDKTPKAGLPPALGERLSVGR